MSKSTRSEERFSRNAETEIYTLSLHDALPILVLLQRSQGLVQAAWCLLDARLFQLQRRRLVDVEVHQIGRAVQQECRDRDLHSFPTRRSSDLGPAPAQSGPRPGRLVPA